MFAWINLGITTSLLSFEISSELSDRSLKYSFILVHLKEFCWLKMNSSISSVEKKKRISRLLN